MTAKKVDLLIIEDNKRNRGVYEGFLTVEPCTYDMVSTGEKGIL